MAAAYHLAGLHVGGAQGLGNALVTRNSAKVMRSISVLGMVGQVPIFAATGTKVDSPQSH